MFFALYEVAEFIYFCYTFLKETEREIGISFHIVYEKCVEKEDAKNICAKK